MVRNTGRFNNLYGHLTYPMKSEGEVPTGLIESPIFLGDGTSSSIGCTRIAVMYESWYRTQSKGALRSKKTKVPRLESISYEGGKYDMLGFPVSRKPDETEFVDAVKLPFCIRVISFPPHTTRYRMGVQWMNLTLRFRSTPLGRMGGL